MARQAPGLARRSEIARRFAVPTVIHRSGANGALVCTWSITLGMPHFVQK